QTGTTFSQDYIERALRANVELARLLVRLFEARFDPELTVGDAVDHGGRRELTDAVLEEIHAALDAVASLDHDRILRSFLTLVQAQTVKNAVIVPTGAKGGFVGKHLPDVSDGSAGAREAWLTEGVECYKTFIRGLLDVTDNLVDGGADRRVEPPPRVVRHDAD